MLFKKGASHNRADQILDHSYQQHAQFNLNCSSHPLSPVSLPSLTAPSINQPVGIYAICVWLSYLCRPRPLREVSQNR